MDARAATYAPTVGIALTSCLLVAACGGGAGSEAAHGGVVGSELVKPDGTGTFLLDPHKNGNGRRLGLTEVFWGRLVDVHDIDASGNTRSQPVFRNFVVDHNLIAQPGLYAFETNPITQATRLVVQRSHADPVFLELLEEAADDMPPVLLRHDDGSTPPPFSFVARNACLVVRFDDLLEDDEDAARDLAQLLRVFTGYPPSTPFECRVMFDGNHGGLVKGEFHSSRVLIDLTSSEAEVVEMATPIPVNGTGLPPSVAGADGSNVLLRIPTQVDAGSGQFRVLRNLGGGALRSTGALPMDAESATMDAALSMRSGGPADTDNGFLFDSRRPELVGAWPVVLDRVVSDPGGVPGIDIVLDLTFQTPCADTPFAGDVITVGSRFLEISEDATFPSAGQVLGVRARLLSDQPLPQPGNIAGAGVFRTTFHPSKPVHSTCWVSFSPTPTQFPALDVLPEAEIRLRFTEAMNPESLRDFDAFQVLRGVLGSITTATDVVVGEVYPSPDLREFAFVPLLPFANFQSSILRLELGRVTDLTGNELVNTPLPVPFSLDRTPPLENNGSLILRFGSDDELEPLGAPDLRGQFFYDFGNEEILGRPRVFQSFPVDRTNPVPSVMIPFAPGVQTPLSPLGSKLQAVWRYADLGWQVSDETKHNLDVIGNAWSPSSGFVVSDFFPRFEMRLAHSKFLPDEGGLAIKTLNSGLVSAPRPFSENVLIDPRSPQLTVHPRELGYSIRPADAFLGPDGKKFVPFPFNSGRSREELTTFTWRDTAVTATAAPNGLGIPLLIEASEPLNIEDNAGSVARSGKVPSIGLPLLMEYRCYPTDFGVGLNALDINIAINALPGPNFRSYSTGGFNTAMKPVSKDPDLELVPSGGFNPSANPPGRPTVFNADNVFYIGFLDVVVRVSRLHTSWIDTTFDTPRFIGSVIQPAAGTVPGTDTIIEFRGADGFTAGAGSRPFNASKLDMYGNPSQGEILHHDDDATWYEDIAEVDGARYVQMRISLVNDIASGASPVLSALAIAFDDE